MMKRPTCARKQSGLYPGLYLVYVRNAWSRATTNINANGIRTGRIQGHEPSKNQPPTIRPPPNRKLSLKVTSTSTNPKHYTPAARYQQNLKSSRRIDPTIVSTIDQFSHMSIPSPSGK